MFNLNGKQWLAIVGAILSVLVVSTAQLTELLGAPMAKTIVSTAGLANLIFQAISVALTSQNATVKDVLAMPGIEEVKVNKESNQVLASIAVDPNVSKIAPIASDAAAVKAIAKEG